MCVLKFSFLTYMKLHYLHILLHRWIYISWDDLEWSQRGLKWHLFVFHLLCRVKSLHCIPTFLGGTSEKLALYLVNWNQFCGVWAFICRSDVPAPDRYTLGGLEFGFILYWWWDSKRANPSGRVKSGSYRKSKICTSKRYFICWPEDFICQWGFYLHSPRDFIHYWVKPPVKSNKICVGFYLLSLEILPNSE